MPAFQGFSPDAFDYLMQLRLRNSKEFYDASKDTYRQLLVQPFTDLVNDIAPTLHEIDENILAVPRVGKTISRMRRDTRFTKDKTMYRKTMWFFLRDGSYPWLCGPGFYFEINPVGFAYGCGMFGAPPAQMELYRRMIGATRRFARIISPIEKAGHFQLNGDMYKRDMANGELPKRLYDWYNRKGVYLTHYGKDTLPIQQASFLDELCAQFGSLKSIYGFFRDVAMRFRAETGGLD